MKTDKRYPDLIEDPVMVFSKGEQIRLVEYLAMNVPEDRLHDEIWDPIYEDYVTALKDESIILDRIQKHEDLNRPEGVGKKKTMITEYHYSFPTRFKTDGAIKGVPVYVYLKSKTSEPGTIIIEGVGPKTKNVFRLREHYLHCHNWSTFFDKLSCLALPEEWGEPVVKRNKRTINHPILETYFDLIFYIAMIQGKLKEKRRGHQTYTLLNTGLVNGSYDYIIACFKKTTRKSAFIGFTTWNKGSLGEDMAAIFDAPPERVSFVNEHKDFFLDVDKARKSEIDIEHIIERLDRLPETYVKTTCLPDAEAEKLYSIYEKKNVNGYGNLIDLGKHLKKNYPDTVDKVHKDLLDAREIAIKRVEWNYKTAVPSYYVKQNKIGMLLPMSLSQERGGEITTEFALALSKDNETGEYSCDTVFSLDIAYTDSRLIARPDSDWLLAPKKIESDT